MAAIFVEPIQGEGGYIVPPAGWLADLRELCDRHGILLVIDEVQTGIGRTGTMWACEHDGVVPDIIAPARAWPAGCRWPASIARADDHGLAARRPRLDVRRQPGRLRRGRRHARPRRGRAGRQRRRRSATHLLAGLRALQAEHPVITDVRGRGLMIGIDLPDHDTAEALEQACFERGLLVLTCGERAIRMAPPLVVTIEQADTALAILADAVRRSAVMTRDADLPTTALERPASTRILDGVRRDGRRRRPVGAARRSPAARSARPDRPATSTTPSTSRHDRVRRRGATTPGAGARRPRAPARRAAPRAQGRARRAGVDRGRQDPLRGPRRGPGDDRHLRLRRRPLAPAARPHDRQRAARPPADGDVAPDGAGAPSSRAFNFPVAVWSWNAALALVCGDPVIWKPRTRRRSRRSPASALFAAGRRRRRRARPASTRCCSAAPTSARRWSPTTAVADRVGHRLDARWAARVAPVVAGRFGRSILELGGNNAAIVAPSADLDLARARHRLLGGRHGRPALHQPAPPDRPPLGPRRARRAPRPRPTPRADRRPARRRHARRPADRRRRRSTGCRPRSTTAARRRRQGRRRRRAGARRRGAPTRSTSARRSSRCRRRPTSCAPRRSRPILYVLALRRPRRGHRPPQRRAAGPGVEHLHHRRARGRAVHGRRRLATAASPTSTSARRAPRSAARSAARRRPAAAASRAPTPGRPTCAAPPTRSTTRAPCPSPKASSSTSQPIPRSEGRDAPKRCIWLRRTICQIV